MLTFRMDETNFAQGEREGLRITTGAGLKVDFDEFASDGDALGFWHLHNGGCQGEGTGLEDASGGGHDLTNYGAESVEDGYRFCRAEDDYMDASLAPGSLSTLTLEAWVRAWATPTDQYGLIALFYKPTPLDTVHLFARRSANPAASGIYFTQFIYGGFRGSRAWVGAEVDALLAAPEAFHVAGVMDSTEAGELNRRLFVNGISRGTLLGSDFLTFSGTRLRLGRRENGIGWDLSAVLDEVRLSATARYASDFTIHRLLASGLYTSPTFDAVRLQADWLDLVPEKQVPDGCQVAWEVRAADETDAFGYPQALWQAYSGDPSTLPDGRYFQWRATLSASADRTVSPLLTSVEARASEAGYDLYRAIGPGPEALDYNVPFARVGPGVTQTETAALDPDAVHWFGIRPVDVDGVESPVTQCEARLELDESGQRVPDRPTGVLDLDARALPLGAVRLSWRYRIGMTGVVPQAFKIFGDGGSGTINYDLPLGEIPYVAGRAWYAGIVEALVGGVEHQLAVRAVAAGDVWDEQPAVVCVTPDATPPAEVDALEAETIL